MHEAIFDSVLTLSGSGILARPAESETIHLDNVVVNWDGSREAVRASRVGMPLLAQAKQVVLLLVDQPVRVAGTSERTRARMLGHLVQHGAKAVVSQVAGGKMKTGEALLAEVASLSGDFFITGGTSRGRRSLSMVCR